MSQKNLHHSIRFMEFISEKEYNEIKELQALCFAKDQTNLKLELDYKLFIGTNSKIKSNKLNEFLYYVDDTLVAYLGISSFGGNIGEVNGLTHPDFRRRGIFQRLFVLVVNECHTRSFSKLLLLSDGKSTSGIDFIKSVGGCYNNSEYRMKLSRDLLSDETSPITLRKSSKDDQKHIAQQNAIFFNDLSEDGEDNPIEEDAPNITTYMVELEGIIIGKIKVEYGEDSAFIYGFGILPDYRGKGYGKAALKETLHIIRDNSIFNVELDVVCTNSNALSLYKACGFVEQSIVNYYEYRKDVSK